MARLARVGRRGAGPAADVRPGDGSPKCRPLRAAKSQIVSKPVDPDVVLALVSSLEWDEAAERPEISGAPCDQPAGLVPASSGAEGAETREPANS